MVLGAEALKDVDLRIDDSTDPLADLNRLLAGWLPKAPAYRLRALDPDSAPRSILGAAPLPGSHGIRPADLRAAIAHARASGRRVRTVLAGHMHHRSKDDQTWRRTHRRDSHDTLHINAARVPRIEAEGARRHHVALAISDEGASAETRWVDQDGEIVLQEPMR